MVGALATAEFARVYDGAQPVLGGLAWERRPIDPVPGPRATEEIANAEKLAPGILLAGPDTRVRDRTMFFAESRMAQFLGEPTVLIDVHAGPAAIAEGLLLGTAALGCDLVVFIDVGGDVLANGDEPGLRSPLCDAVMLQRAPVHTGEWARATVEVCLAIGESARRGTGITLQHQVGLPD